MKWLYQVVSVQGCSPAELHHRFKEAGEWGWELVAVSSGIAYFKQADDENCLLYTEENRAKLRAAKKAQAVTQAGPRCTDTNSL